MKQESYTRTERILMLMRIVTWIAFIGFMIEAGAVLTSFVISCINPIAAKHLYPGLNLFDLSQYSFPYYVLSVFFMVTILIIKAYVCYLVIKKLSGITLANPFTIEIAQTLERISYILFGAWIVGLFSSAYTGWVLKITGPLAGKFDTGELLFMAGLVFIISQVFKRGVEIQSENDLTV